jgi:hypothetical protein
MHQPNIKTQLIWNTMRLTAGYLEKAARLKTRPIFLLLRVGLCGLHFPLHFQVSVCTANEH